MLHFYIFLFITGFFIPKASSAAPIPLNHFHKSMELLGLTRAESPEQRASPAQQQEALFRIFHMAGYLSLPKLWKDIHGIPSIRYKPAFFKKIREALQKASHSGKFDPAAFRLALLKTKGIEWTEWIDFFLYIAQEAFQRKPGQERYSLTEPKWMQENQADYEQDATTLGLIAMRTPSRQTYDRIWVTGSRSAGMAVKLAHLKLLLKRGDLKVSTDKIKMLVGDRELYANLDSPVLNLSRPLTLNQLIAYQEPHSINAGKSYIAGLAKRMGIKLDPRHPFIEYTENDRQRPKERAPGRVYPHYAAGETKTLTEAVSARDLLRQFPGKVEVIETVSVASDRPTTATTAAQAAQEIIPEISAHPRPFFILLIALNPYIDRQTISTYRAVREAFLKKGMNQCVKYIHIEGAGLPAPSAERGKSFSELGGLIAERWRDAYEKAGYTPDIIQAKARKLMYQTRPKHYPFPKLPSFK